MGTKIPSFEQFIKLCKNIGLHPYIELKTNGGYTEAQIQGLVDIVENCGMKGKVTWISFSATYLTYVKNYDSDARLGYVVSSISASTITTAQGLQTETNEVFIDSSQYTDSACELCINANIPLEVWTVDDASVIEAMNSYVTGVTSNSQIAGKVLFDSEMA
jgi:hypothetical protein